MIVYGLQATSQATRRSVTLDGASWEKSDYIVPVSGEKVVPGAFLIEQHPGSVIPAHFHRENQFQIFVDGSGRIGGHDVSAVTVHYAGACTGYGPIVAGENGLVYLTLRAAHDVGAILLSNSKPPKGPRRGATVGPIEILAPQALGETTGVTEQELIAPTEEGLSAALVVIGKGEQLPGAASLGQGRFIVVVAGSIATPEATLTRLESFYIDSDAAWPNVVAGENGAAVLNLAVPPRDSRYSQALADFKVTVASQATQ